MEVLSPTADLAEDNVLVASRCERIAWLLQAQEANPYRVRAWREAAAQIRQLPTSVVDACRQDGEASLVSIPHIGRGIAGAIGQFADTGRFPLLDSLEGEHHDEALLLCVPGLGPTLAKRIHDELGIETLEELQTAAHDGRLDALPGFGRRRLQAIRSELDSMLRQSRRQQKVSVGQAPTAALLLAIDRSYREKADVGSLRKIAPRRMNPSGEAWLPIWHTDRDGWHFTALFSNSPAAHRAGKTRDWVIIFYEGPEGHGQVTAVSHPGGPKRGRVLRGLPPALPPTKTTQQDRP